MKRQGRIWALALALTLLAPPFVASGALGQAAHTSGVHAQITAALGIGDAKQAEQLADTALAGSGLSPAEQSLLLADRGTAREAQGRHDEALVDLTHAIGMHILPAAEQAQAFFARGTILDSMGHIDDAIGDYNAALTLQPRFSPALNNRANAWRRQNRLADAKRDYLASLAAGNLQPEYSYFGLGQIAEAAGNLAGARGFYNQAMAANPNFALAAERLAALGDRTAGGDAGPIHLKPPKSVRIADAPIVLKPPVAAPARPRVVPASYPGAKGDSAPGLRPALDAAVQKMRGQKASDQKSLDRGRQVQLGAWRSEEEAGQGWNRAQKRSGGLLSGLSPHIVAVDLPGKGRYYRLRVAPAGETPGKFCEALKAQGVDCLPARD